MKKIVRWLARDDAGQDLVEYGLLIATFAVLALTALLQIGPKVIGYFTTFQGGLP